MELELLYPNMIISCGMRRFIIYMEQYKCKKEENL